MKFRKKRLYVDIPTKGIYWTVLYVDGRGPIPVPVMLNRATIRRCKRGIPFECVLADAIMTYARAHPEAFPHPVLFAHVLKTTIFIITAYKNGQPRHAVRYEHRFGDYANTFDEISKKQFIEKFDGHGFTLELQSARKSRVGEARTGGNGTGGSRSHVVSRGAMARAQAAGLIPRNAAA